MDLQILHLEDSAEDAFLIHRALADAGVTSKITLARSRPEFEEFMDAHSPDLILADGAVLGISGLEALSIARQHLPGVAFICLSGSDDKRQIAAALAAGANDFIPKDSMGRLVTAVRSIAEKVRLTRANECMLRLVGVVQELSLARDLQSIMTTVRTAARELTGADGATFVLRDDDKCFYADEDAISPLWKGQRFPMSQCISGWVMLNRQSAVIEDIYADPRIPADAYRPTFVKSLAMVPIRTESPIGAIGTYWATLRLPTAEEVELLQALANTTSVAMENVRMYEELEQRVEQRTAQLAAANEELESFAYAVSHDLGAPLRCIRGYSELLLRECQQELGESGKLYLEKVQLGTQQMRNLMDDLLRLSRVTQAEMKMRPVNLSDLVEERAGELRRSCPDHAVKIDIAKGLEVQGDLGLLRVALDNLLSNAWKFSGRTENALVEFGAKELPGGGREFFVRDNGAGFDMRYADKLFRPFRRLHTQDEFPGSGIGLCTVKRVVQRHGGKIRAESEPGNGATFYFTLGGSQ
jgi:signal transduction histidine kinase/CheY-like chemotaxis protein